MAYGKKKITSKKGGKVLQTPFADAVQKKV